MTGVHSGRAAPTQQRMWLLSKLHPESWSYNITSSIELTGELDLPALRRAASDLVDRHEVLRTTFQDFGSEVHLAMAEAAEPSIDVIDLSSDADPWQAVVRHTGAVAETPMDLKRGPLFKMLLCRLGPARHVLTLFVHHIVADAWSLGIMWEELGLLYGRHLGEDVMLKPVGLPYREYAAEQWQRAESPAARAELARWLDRLEGVDTDNSLRTDRRRPAVPSFRGVTLELQIPAELARRLQARARSLRSTPFMVLAAGFAADLAHYDRRRDIVIATQVAGRADPRVARTAGFFVNTLPLRFDLSGSPTLANVVEQAREVALEAYGTEQVTYEQLLQEVSPLGDRSMNPLAQVAFQLLNVPIPDVAFGDLGTRRWWDTSRGAKFDLSVMLVPEPGGGFLGLVTYAVELFEEATVRELWKAYLRALDRLASDPSLKLWDLALVDAEGRRAVHEWSRGLPASEGAGSLLETVERRAGDHGGRVAIRAPDREITYAGLWGRSGAIAASLRDSGVERGHVVVVSCSSRADAICAILGSWRAGATLMVVEPAYTSSRTTLLLDELDVTTGICSPGDEPEIAGVRWLAAEPAVSAEPPPGNLALGFSDPAYIVTTSGTTGQPRAIAARMGAFSSFVVREASKLSAPQVVVQVPPLSFDPGMRDVFTTLAAGAELLLPAGIETNPVDAIADALREGPGDSILAIVPSVLEGVVNELAPGAAGVRLRVLRCCGEALPRALAQRALATLGCVPYNDYGSNECTMVSTSGQQHPSAGDSHLMPIGRPMPGVEAWVLGPAMQVLPARFTGEIHIAGEHVTDGYLGDPAATTERFVPHPHGPPGARLHRTGDLGYFDSAGVLQWVGRVDRQVKIRGVRIEVAEIEAALLQHEDVRDAVVVPVGEGAETRLTAYVVAADGCSKSDLREHLRGRVPRASVPSAVQLLEAIPRSARGKVQTSLLPPSLPGSTLEERLPLADEVEQAIGDVWVELLGTDDVAANDDFFELGGHSLAAMTMAARVSALVGRTVSIADVFDHPTVRELGEFARAVPPSARI